MTDQLDKLWTIDDVAKYFQVRPSVIRYWVSNSGLPYIKIGKHYRFDSVDIQYWIESKKTIRKSNEDLLKLIT